MVKQWTVDKLKVKVFESRLEMGRNAAREVSKTIRELLMSKNIINIIFAAAPSQNEFLAALSTEEGVDWSRINAFQMDEYVGLKSNATQQFGKFLKERLFDNVFFNEVYYLKGDATDSAMEAVRYAALLHKFPPDLVCMGIGENTHIAFNDPYVADFNDPLLVKVVTLAEESRQQQVTDGCFTSIDEVPVSAITLTIPALLKTENIFCVVPGANKAKAVYHTLKEKIDERYPSTVLRNHSNATLFLDKESAALI